MKILATIFAVVILFSGNATAQQMANYDYKQREAAFWEHAKGILLECKQQKDRGQIRSFVALVKCSNQNLAEGWTWYKLGFDDLAALFLAKRLEIAERIDRGALTEGQAQIEGIQAYQQLQAVAQERQRSAQATAHANAAAVVQARTAAAVQDQARSAAAMNSLAGAAAALSATQQYWVPQFPQPSQPRQLTCSLNRSPSLFGPTLSCN